MTEAFDRWQHLRGFSPATRKRRRWTLRNLQLESGRTLDAVTLDDIETFLLRRPSAGSRRAVLSDLRVFYRWAIRRDLLTIDPTAKIDSVKVPKRAPSPIPLHDLERAIAHASPRMRCILMLGAYAGLRVSEISNLHSNDCWPTHIVVRDGKGGKDRTVPLHPDLGRLLAGRQGYIIGTSAGNVSLLVRNYFASLGIPHRPHDLRHSFGTEAARVARGDLSLVANLMGHESVTTTQRYVGYRPEGAGVVAGLYAA